MAGLNNQQIIDRARSMGIELSDAQADQILSQAWDQGQWGADPAKVDSLLKTSSSQSTSENQYTQSVQTMVDPLVEAEKKIGEYLKGKYGENPFDIDEEQYRLSAQEQYDPYYNAELGDYMTGIQRQRSRSQADEERLRGELTTQTENYVGRAKREIDSAIESSGEGFAGAGLYFSGKRLRKEGEIGITGEENIRDYTRQQGLRMDESNLRQQRTMEDTGLAEQTYKRNWTADRETALRQNMLQQKQEEAQRRMYEASQYAGGDYANRYMLNNPLLV
jgi:hypothetical protein